MRKNLILRLDTHKIGRLVLFFLIMNSVTLSHAQRSKAFTKNELWMMKNADSVKIFRLATMSTAEVYPMAAAPAWNHHGVAPVGCEGFEHICCLEHQSSTRSLILIWVSLDETVVFIADQDRHRLLGFFGLFEGDGDPVGVGVALHQVIFDAKGV